MIQDSGNRREFDTGAVRDIQEGKGRCDLLPLDIVAEFMHDCVLERISCFQREGDTGYLYDALDLFAREAYGYSDKDLIESSARMILDLSIHFEEGAEKYGENNWQKGLPVNCYIDSAVRHYLKWLRGDTDEHHDRAFVWNIVCCLWTIEHIGKVEKVHDV